ncbi:glycosyl transferase family 90 [Candidatus Rhabdochlamydia porcellionis]|uniref:Glycosyl transferase family 90 n=1 Tax=Candidatus Rhabdochlamydia porcellionis TaxID=225148 RepID=A0ABX8YXY7_9BACT|nr:glycosyl transferase family 90 [Candidatus Rhabdochlamydia porcellionis]QZA58134.1 Glycosyl transferase family 90 [Candidatus Rhabdochlamydia porcellionis]
MSVQANEFKDLHEKLNDPKYTWMDKQIKRDLAAFEEKGISLHMLESTWQGILASPEKDSACLVRYKIVNNNITFSSPTANLDSYFCRVMKGNFIDFTKKIRTTFINFIKEMTQYLDLPDVEFLLCLEDSIERPIFLELCQAPIFCISKKKKNNKVILYPSTIMALDPASLCSTILHANSIHPWESKISKAFWRGIAAGGPYHGSWDLFPRPSLIVTSYYHPEDVDAAFVGNFLFTTAVDIRDYILNFKPPREFVSISDQIAYKYLIAVDGQTWPTSLEWQLLSNSVVLKSDSDWLDWFYELLTPYEHYVPYEKDYNDILTKINWLRENDGLARKISEQATEVALNFFTKEAAFVYFYKLFSAYACLQNFQPN